ncbi:hypothetical protein BT63DRAFT_482324 [Microthyrium microscopicum]|uniref:Protein HRI1 n=1 Tax=Microthyrium microscopicum TaxID=703497 RepID=A0A6A6U2M1_9PEZI|nr:hypothetical protein BT63DRAFT_482324 [Microthyrium microscopicum]
MVFPLKPSISRRHGFRWLPHPTNPPPTEPASVLVLTTPTGIFIDVRLHLRHPIPSIPSTFPPLSDPAHPANTLFEHPSTFTGLEWAFDGLVNYYPDGQDTDGGAVRGVWQHRVDSSTKTPASDEGIMRDRSDGAVVETGVMVNAETGMGCGYEEIWVDVPACSVGGMRGLFVAVKCEDERTGAMGRVIWMGQYCQGIMRKGNDVTVERWEFEADDEEWRLTFRVGGGSLPCRWLFGCDDFTHGMRIRVPSLEGAVEDAWFVVEQDWSPDEQAPST